jgi:hypothetical protein
MNSNPLDSNIDNLPLFEDLSLEDQNFVSGIISDFVEYYCFYNQNVKICWVDKRNGGFNIYLNVLNFGPYRIEFDMQENGDSLLSYVRYQKSKDGEDHIYMKQYRNNVDIPLANVRKS